MIPSTVGIHSIVKTIIKGQNYFYYVALNGQAIASRGVTVNATGGTVWGYAYYYNPSVSYSNSNGVLSITPARVSSSGGFGTTVEYGAAGTTNLSTTIYLIK